MRTLPLFAVLLLAACGGRVSDGGISSPIATPAPRSAAEAECRAEASQSPAVQNIYRRVVIGNAASEEQSRGQRIQAEQSAFADCLRRRGLSRGGGVEPLRRGGL